MEWIKQNTVVICGVISLALFYIFGSRDFAINMTMGWVLFGMLELCNVLLEEKTISRKFWDWSQTADRWKVYLVAVVVLLTGLFFSLHLLYEI